MWRLLRVAGGKWGALHNVGPYVLHNAVTTTTTTTTGLRFCQNDRAQWPSLTCHLLTVIHKCLENSSFGREMPFNREM